jgi:DNA-binding beta-propeller fold protein YncE
MSHSRPACPARAIQRAALIIPLLASGLAVLAQGRGDYMNVESPQVSPLALATVNGKTVLLACNTPDDSIEIWDTDEAIQPPSARFIQRLWVGLEPVSVLVVGNKFWTANFLGDSVTAGILDPNGASVSARILATQNVGDEPMDIAHALDGATATIFVTLHSSSALAWLDAATLRPRVGGVAANDLVQSSGTPPLGLKEPRAVRVRGGRVYALGLKGGVPVLPLPPPFPLHDLDVLSSAAASPLSFNRSVAGLGSTNFNMRFASNGDLYVVGGEAENFTTDNKIEVRTRPTGFVISTLHRVVGAGTASPTVFRRDLNLTSTGQIVPKNPPFSAEGRPAAQPTDVALLETSPVAGKALPAPGGPEVIKIFIAAFGSDRIAVLEPPAGGVASNPDVATWIRRTIDFPYLIVGGSRVTTLGGNPRWGPRGLVLGRGASGTRLYVMNRLDNSILIIDPATEQLLANQSFSLANDPTPSYVRQGREFLYNAEISGNGFVSCASCHVDGRTDALSWRLGPDPNLTPPLEPPPSQDFIASLIGTGIFSGDPNAGFQSDPDYHISMYLQQTFDPEPPADKREMVTQSLQGLLNFEVPLPVKTLFTNAPYHWRGDKPSIREFNEAFETLLVSAHVSDPNNPPGPAGLTSAQMDLFEEFVHSLHYPPNPKQPKERAFSPGSEGGARGMELFHERPFGVVNNRACAHCHALPSGSNGRLTVFLPDPVFPGYVTVENRQPIESAALRGLFQKEPLLEPDGRFDQSFSTTPRTGHFGLSHTGILQFTAPGTPNGNLTSINTFIDVFFPTQTTSPDAHALKQFVHEFDWGTAPVVGDVVFLTAAILADPNQMAVLQPVIDRMLGQSGKANAGVAAWLNRPNDPNAPYRGFRWHPGLQLWVEEPGLTPFAVLPLPSGPADSLVLLATPAGSQRRVANPAGGGEGGIPFVVQPANVDLLPMTPNTAYAPVPGFVKNWSPPSAPGAPPGLDPNDAFFFLKPVRLNGVAVGEVFAKTVRLFQYGLLDGQNAVSYGVASLRHEAPRRLRVRGNDILTGARLLLSIPNPPPGYGGPPPSDPNAQPTFPTLTIELPLHATDQLSAGRPVWETAAELAPIVAYTLMLGGPGAPGVAETMDDVGVCEYLGIPCQVAEPDPNTLGPPYPLPFDPDDWNWHKVEVRNPAPPGTPPNLVTSPAVWRQLRMP